MGPYVSAGRVVETKHTRVIGLSLVFIRYSDVFGTNTLAEKLPGTLGSVQHQVRIVVAHKMNRTNAEGTRLIRQLTGFRFNPIRMDGRRVRRFSRVKPFAFRVDIVVGPLYV